ncbi:M48 family metallopeptidase, partial [Chloroflexota bacterium]
ASGRIRVAIPTRISFKTALEFILLKKAWIQKHLVIINNNENAKKAFIDRFQAIDKVESRKQLADRLYCLAKECGFKYNRITIREQRTRWGSCSHKNNISLNLKLVLLPKELIDYVMLHELVHTRIPNHSKQFWIELSKYVGNSKVMAKKLIMLESRLL